MQSNTTGHSMESIFEFFALIVSTGTILAYGAVFANLVFVFKIHSKIKIQTEVAKTQLEVTHDLVEIVEQLDNHLQKSFLDLKRQADTDQLKTSMKPNNWDSMKQAFNIPKRVAIDE